MNGGVMRKYRVYRVANDRSYEIEVTKALPLERAEKRCRQFNAKATQFQFIVKAA
jgi:hypothetical protein